MLQLLQMVDGYPCPARDPAIAGLPVSGGPEMVTVAAGSYAVGCGSDGFAYDNERPRHVVELDEFEIDRAPVSNEQFAAFIAETG